jgi:biotin--protein ligase
MNGSRFNVGCCWARWKCVFTVLFLVVGLFSDCMCLDRRILLYRDVGVSKDSFRHAYSFFKNYVRIVDSGFLKNRDWVGITKMLIIPGGADKPYSEKLNGSGCGNIKEFVRNGGVYLGICAGGYFGTSKVEFALNTDMEINEYRELSFFPGVSCGPFLKDFVYYIE